jgi:hypothetical protein
MRLTPAPAFLPHDSPDYNWGEVTATGLTARHTLPLATKRDFSDNAVTDLQAQG